MSSSTTVDKNESEFKIFATDFFSIEIFALESLPPYKIAGMKPEALIFLICDPVVFSLLVAYKLFMLLFG